jgi:hypothetical protein
MRKSYALLLCTLVALLLPAMRAWGHLSDYGFQVTTGEYIDISDGTQILAPGADDVTSNVFNIGFTFYFDGVPYTQLSVSANGLIGFGGKVSQCWVNQLTTTSGLCVGVGGYDYTLASVPHLAPFWDDLRVPTTVDDGFNGSVRYQLVGNAPRRILVIDFPEIETDYRSYSNYSTFQVRLYEGTSNIEFYYDYLNPAYSLGDGATIGMAVSPSNYLSVTPVSGGSATVSTSTVNNSYSPRTVAIPSGTVYRFSTCSIVFEGNVQEGGVDPMASGDTVLRGMVTTVGSTDYFRPMGMGVEGGCKGRNYTIEIIGPAAAEYDVEPIAGNVTSQPSFPTISFSPTRSGPRYAELVITDDFGRIQYIWLAAEGASRLIWSGDVAEGGTTNMEDGDVILSNAHVDRGGVGTFRPLSITNIDANPEGTDAEVSYWIKGMSNGQYTVTPETDVIPVGATVTPTITFMPNGIGPTIDSLFVLADGELRAYQLAAFSDAAGAEFYVGNTLIDSSSALFPYRFSCVGEGVVSLPLEVRNIGSLPFEITGVEFYRTDSAYGQGVPRYPLLRDEMGNPIPSTDYMITEQPVVAGTTNQQTFPIVVPIGTSRLLYFTFIGQAPGKRFARAYIRTNSQVMSGYDVNGELVEGLLRVDLFGQGVGGLLSDNMNGGLPKAVVFPGTDVGDSSLATAWLYNPGTCDLRISLRSFSFTAGDIEEFEVVSTPRADTNVFIDQVRGDVILRPGARTSFVTRFMPTQHGARRATMRLITNDSSIQYPGITERGSYYLDFYGGGSSGLYASGISFGTALIGGSGADQLRDVVRLLNSLPSPIEIVAILIEGADGAEFTQSSGAPWPTLPRLINSGEELVLDVTFAPVAGGQAGPRAAVVKIVTAKGDTIIAPISGTAGTRTVSVNPSSLNFAVSVGKVSRRTITITNNGTMPLRLQQPVISGPTAGDFSVNNLPRLLLAPGQSEFLEVTYNPSITGGVTAVLEINSNSTDGPILVNLNGLATKTRLVEVDPGQAMTGLGDDPAMHNGTNRPSELISGVATTTNAAGMMLRQSIPNPGREIVEIGYLIPTRGQVTLALYDASGRLLRTLDAGMREAGEQNVRIDVSSLPSGIYHYRLMAGGMSLSRTLTVAR